MPCSPEHLRRRGCANVMSASGSNGPLENGADLQTNIFPRGCRNTVFEEEHDGEGEFNEDEDLDFNPYLKESPSPAPSSNLSSENKSLDGKSPEIIETDATVSCLRVCSIHGRGSDHDEEKCMIHENLSSEGLSERCLEESLERKKKRRKLCSTADTNSHMESSVETGMISGLSLIDNGLLIQKSTSEFNDEDAICMRTRARYSLESSTLDELEAFLQVTDDEDDLQNADDEEEYRKFLAGVLQGDDDGRGQLIREAENSDEDDDNDADFEMELEEELESDDEEVAKDKSIARDNESVGRRPETRQNRRKKVGGNSKKNSQDLTKRTCRPLVPILPSLPIAPALLVDRRNIMPETGTVRGDDLLNRFTPNQLGQLHCLIHEHVQLLVQVYSLCVFDPSRQHVATQLQCLIQEMLDKSSEFKKLRSDRHPSHCFYPPHAFPSFPDEVSLNTWLPSINGPMQSVTEVAPLTLARQYLDDVSSAVREYKRRRVESQGDGLLEKEALFPLVQCAPRSGDNSDGVMQNTPPTVNLVQSAPGQQVKKTLAATLVESAKKQSIALVPKEIAKLAIRFFALFNPSLFPHKPPPAAVANRVLFTEAEDDLLALGLMEFNSNWKAIQERFLPCKSKHQIFVRQKNRCSSKAPENPIKAVRRMKNSPLTSQEISCIHEGLRYFKYDWMSVCKFVVPYRDPSLLPRQWRIASGSQKSYKCDAAQKEKRRLYALKQRSKATSVDLKFASRREVDHCGGHCSGDDVADNTGETYLHEGFLADWRPGICDLFRSVTDLPEHVPSRYPADNSEQSSNTKCNQAQGSINVHRSSHPPTLTFHSHGRGPGQTTLSSQRQIYMRPYRARKSYDPRIVRIAPDLPPVNLPPSVRVISQSAFRRNPPKASNEPSIFEKMVPQQQGDSGSVCTASAYSLSANDPKDTTTNLNQGEAGSDKEKCVLEERNTDPGLQMHPLLFQDPVNGRVSYHSANLTSGSSSAFSFSMNRPQLLSLFSSPRQSKTVDSTQKLCSVGFHPLLQRCDKAHDNVLTEFSTQTTDLNKKKKPCSSSNRLEEVDLNMQPSSKTKKERGLGDSLDHLQDSYIDHIPVSSTVTEKQKPVHQSEGDAANAQETGDDSNLEIVMEQEELSDSDEEIDENVEFECEEMADSELEEGAGSDEIVILIQDKDASGSVVSKSLADGDIDREPEMDSVDQCEGEFSSCFSRSSLTVLGKDSMSSPWLSLDSRSSDQFKKHKAGRKHGDEAFFEEPIQPGQITNKESAAPTKDTHPGEVAGSRPLLCLGPSAVSTLKKSKKRTTSRANAKVSTAPKDLKHDAQLVDIKDQSC